MAEIDVGSIKFYNASGQEIDPDTGKVKTSTTDTSGSGSGWLSGVLSAIPGVLSALFPSGVNGSNQPVISTYPNGNTNVQLAGNNNMIFIIGAILLVGFFLFTGKQPIQPAKK